MIENYATAIEASISAQNSSLLGLCFCGHWPQPSHLSLCREKVTSVTWSIFPKKFGTFDLLSKPNIVCSAAIL
jgi:hypothetical protein